MSCNIYISQCLPEDDSPDAEVERLVHLGLKIVGNARHDGRSRSRRRLRPKENFEFRVESDQGHDLLLKVYKEGGNLIAELHHQSVKMRALHTHEFHHNPRCRQPLPNGHMHFPTSTYPLSTAPSSYAYEIHCSDEENLAHFLALFCALLNIELGAFQTTVDSATSR